MVVRFACPECGHKLKAGEADRGRRARCSKCSAVVQVPTTDAPKQPPRPDDGEFLEPPALRTVPPQDDEIDMTPMIDVVFQLLIFFMVTSTFALQKALPIPAPETIEGVAQQQSLAPTNPDDVLIVRVDADDAFWVDDVLAVSRPDLIAKIRQARLKTGPGGEPGPRRLLVNVDPDAHHEAAVTALDAGSAAGMEEIRLQSEDDSL
jgi:biopolymer transport protein ExbD